MQVLGVVADGEQGFFIGFALGERKEFARIAKAASQIRQGRDNLIEQLFFLAQFLIAFAVAPDRRVFSQPVDLGETLYLCIKVKDTSATRPCVWSSRR